MRILVTQRSPLLAFLLFSQGLTQLAQALLLFTSLCFASTPLRAGALERSRLSEAIWIMLMNPAALGCCGSCKALLTKQISVVVLFGCAAEGSVGLAQI
jgi:hypothetical protein